MAYLIDPCLPLESGNQAPFLTAVLCDLSEVEMELN